MRLFAFRHLGRMLRARLFHKTFRKYEIFDQRAIIKGARRAFELISQSIYKNELHDLVERNICSVKTIQRFSEAMHEMTPRQHDLLDLSQDDIVSIAPGVLGPFQNIRQVLRENVVHLTYSILCCAFYRKKIHYDAVEKLPLLEPNDVKEDSILAIPSEYGYAAPRLVFGYMDFSHLLDTSTRKVDPTVNLFDFQARFRAYPNERLPADQREFWISRGGYLQKEGVKKIFVFDWVFRGQLPKRVDVIKASHQAFSIIVDAVLKDDLDLLRRRGLCTVPSCLQYHRDELSKLSSKQKKVFEVTKDDLLGRHGILRAFHDHPFHNMRIISALKDDSTRTNYLLYGVMLVALYKKKLLFNAVCNHPLPSSYEWGTNERMILRMPPGYGFLQRKHLVVYLEFAQPLNLESRTITDDVTLFDFHIACF
ncbi:unnamed protein product [Toxocara canis]|uniref:Uncharacterized protein n=1 Tax=Toxocara canis TaxID=6265 RepID=A0A183TYK4_TOXCA|nr:unnamed protein product [Toxocara canis]